VKLSERLRRARQRLAGGWSPGAVYAERRVQPEQQTPWSGSHEWCESTDEVAERFTIRGALEVDGEPFEAIRLLCLLQDLALVRTAATQGIEAELLAAGLNAWECQPGRTSEEVQMLLSTAIARAVAIERGRGK
jgi:hypothetical protein